jgi:hypothetical protein
MGILSHPATPAEALSEGSSIYRAALVINPDELPDPRDFVKRMRSYKTDLPIFAFCPNEINPAYEEIFDGCFTRPSVTPNIAEKIVRYANENKHARIGDYRGAGFNASSNLPVAYYFLDRLELTKTEKMILRFLIRSYPLPRSAKDIIKYAFKAGRTPEPSSVRTHISAMNRKMKKVIGRKMIGFIDKRGYLIITPEFKIIATDNK